VNSLIPTGLYPIGEDCKKIENSQFILQESKGSHVGKLTSEKDKTCKFGKGQRIQDHDQEKKQRGKSKLNWGVRVKREWRGFIKGGEAHCGALGDVDKEGPYNAQITVGLLKGQTESSLRD